MKAIIQDQYGPPEMLRLDDTPQPVPDDNEVLVRVHAAGVNWADYSIVTGVPYMIRLYSGLRRPRHGIGGSDFSGRVDAVGSKVTHFREGEEVFGWGKGAFAEYAAVPETQLVSKPSAISHEQAAGVPMAATVALQALRDVGKVKPGQRVLIVGASGGIGTMAVQIAKEMGAEVTGVCSTDNVELVRSIGADHVIDYTTDDFTEMDDLYDFILDIADTHSLAERRRVLTPNGVLIPNSGEGGRVIGSLGRIIGARLLSPFVSHKLHPFLSLSKREDLIALRELIESGQLVPVVGRTFPLAETAKALELVGRRHSQGKTVITI